MAIQINDVLERVRQAQGEYDQALGCEDPHERHSYLRLAYGNLSQAAADAYMYFSAKPETGVFAEGGLCTWARDELGEITRVIGAQYYEQGLVQNSRLEAEWELWLNRVRIFVDKLSSSRKDDLGQVAAKDWKEEELYRKKKRVEMFNKGMFDRTGAFGGMN